MLRITQHTKAILQALLVTFLWSTSWVLIKQGLGDIPPLIFAGLRYSLAFVFLLLLAMRRGQLKGLQRLNRRDWFRLVVLGVVFYALTQGAQFLGLAYLPAVTVNLLLNFTSIMVALLGWMILSEKPTQMQWIGILLTLVGALVYFFPVVFPRDQAVGYMAVLIGVIANALSSLLGREINRRATIEPLQVTVVSMGVGGALLLISGLGFEPLPALTLKNWAVIIWLALVNTAFAFTLWNLTLRTLSAVESSVINSTMLIQIPILAVVFLGEVLGGKEIAGLLIAVLGVLLVQLARKKG